MKNTLQYITDDKGNKISVILPIEEYQKIMDDLEELEDIRLYDEAMEQDEESIPFEQYLQQREQKKNA